MRSNRTGAACGNLAASFSWPEAQAKNERRRASKREWRRPTATYEVCEMATKKKAGFLLSFHFTGTPQTTLPRPPSPPSPPTPRVVRHHGTLPSLSNLKSWAGEAGNILLALGCAVLCCAVTNASRPVHDVVGPVPSSASIKARPEGQQKRGQKKGVGWLPMGPQSNGWAIGKRGTRERQERREWREWRERRERQKKSLSSVKQDRAPTGTVGQGPPAAPNGPKRPASSNHS